MNSDTAPCLIVGSCGLVTFSRYSNMKFLDTLVLSLNRNDDGKSKEFSTFLILLFNCAADNDAARGNITFDHIFLF